MSIKSEIARISANIANAFSVVAAKGGTVPTGATSDDLATAIGTITAGGMYAFYIDESGHLICAYDTHTAPAFSIDDSGHLICTYDTAEAPPLSIDANGHLIWTLEG